MHWTHPGHPVMNCLHLLTPRCNIRAKYNRSLMRTQVMTQFLHGDLSFTLSVTNWLPPTITSQGRVYELPGVLHGIAYTSWPWTCVRFSLNTRTHLDKLKPYNYFKILTWYDSCTLFWSGHLLCSLCLHLSEFFCRQIHILATIQRRVEKCRRHLFEILPRWRMLRQSAWTDWWVGRAKHHRYECHFHGRDIV